MKKLSKTFWRGINGILTILLGILGFSACGPGADMYGTPHADYIIKGKVTSETNEPIQGIQIRSPFYEGRVDTFYTNKNGEFTYKRESFPGESIPLLLTDIDGEANGGDFASDSVSVSFEGVKLQGGDGSWYDGKAEKEVTIKLKKK